jgi:hypothetical protein
MRGRIESFVMYDYLPVRLLLCRMMARKGVYEYIDIAQRHIVCAFQAPESWDCMPMSIRRSDRFGQ